MNVNATHPVTTESRIGFYHNDHDFKHENFILYLTPTDGGTMIEGVPYTPMKKMSVSHSQEVMQISFLPMVVVSSLLQHI